LSDPDELEKSGWDYLEKNIGENGKFAVPYQNKLNMTLPYNTI